MKTPAAWITALATFAFVGSLEAHHSISMFDIGKPIWIKGTVASFDAVNPHVMFTVEHELGDGQLETWTVEGPGLRNFNLRGGRRLQPGEIVEVCGFALREEVVARNSDARARARQFISGHVLVRPDGQMQIFGGYGKLVNCVRETDEVEAWAAFLNSGARDIWCNSMNLRNFPTLPSRAFVDEVNRRLVKPCPPSDQN